MKQDKSKEQKNPNWQQKPQHPSMPNQQPRNPNHTPGKKPQGGCGCN